MAGSVKAVVSPKILEFTPDSSSYSCDVSVKDENELDVTVTNNSDKFASFQVELSTPGLDENSQIKWYRVEPEICAKKPPGSETTFHVVITKAPIPAYDITIDPILKVFSVEHENLYTSQKLKLTIKKPLKSLRVEVPIEELKVNPGDAIEIPVIAYNLSPKISEITLTCSELDPDWMSAGRERTLIVEPGESEKTSFLCQPPRDTPSKEYKFTVNAKSNTSQYTAREQRILEILPDGVVKFSCSDKQQKIPGKGLKKSNFATYELAFKNQSNLPQRVNIAIPEKEQQQGDFQTIPEELNLALGETKIMQLVAKKKRHWLGLKQILKFAVSAELTNRHSEENNTEIYADPNTQVLELKVLPIIPFLLQVGGGTLILLLLLLNWLLQPRVYHAAPVNSVRFFGNGSLVFSASSDQTIRRWQVDDSAWQLNIFRLKHKQPLIAETEQTQKAVRVIRQSPKDNDQIAVGLENGEVKLWDISTNKQIKSLSKNRGDRVFDLVFSQNGRYLYSGHGSGLVNQWNLENYEKQKSINAKFTVYALAINESTHPSPLIFIAGRFNKLAVWNGNNQDFYEQLQYKWRDWDNKDLKPVFGQHHYITSLATANNILASADNQGYITLWNIDRIRECINKSGRKQPVLCDEAILAQGRDGHGHQPVRSVALTQNGRYLASAGDDGRVMLWSLTEGLEEGKMIAQSDARFNSVDIKALNNSVLVTSGDDHYKVNLYRVNGGKENEGSK